MTRNKNSQKGRSESYMLNLMSKGIFFLARLVAKKIMSSYPYTLGSLAMTV